MRCIVWEVSLLYGANMKFATLFYFLVLAFVADAVTFDLSDREYTRPLGPPVGIMVEKEPALHPPFEEEEVHDFLSTFDAPLGHIEYNKPEYIPGYIPKPKYPARRD